MAKEKSLTHKIFQENEMGKYEVASEIENQEKSVKNLSVFFPGNEMGQRRRFDSLPFHEIFSANSCITRKHSMFEGFSVKIEDLTHYIFTRFFTPISIITLKNPMIG